MRDDWTISKEFAFSAAHQLRGLPDDHQCSRLHGHNYVVRVEVTGELNEIGFVIDYGELSPLGLWLADNLDHRNLNEVMPVNPTAEHLAQWLVEMVLRPMALPRNVTRVRLGVSETPKTWAWYETPLVVQ